MPPLVSIIIPTYNTGRYLPQALDSIFAQTYPHYEVIVVDDGSTDETQAFIQAYRNRIHYLQQNNQGVSAARNYGLQVAQGEWVLFLDADDFISPTKLREQLAEARPETAILHSAWWLVDEVGQCIGIERPYLQAPRLDLETGLFWKPVFPAAMLFRRSWIEKVGAFDTSLAHAEDVDLVLRILAQGGKAIWHKEATAYYRQRVGSASTKSLQQSLSMERVLDKIFAMPQIPKRIQSIEKSVRYYSLLWYAWRLLDDGDLLGAKANLLKAQTLRQRRREYLLLEWQAQYHGSAAVFFGDCLGLSNPQEILAGDYHNLSAAAQIELVFDYIATRKSLPDDLRTDNLHRAGKLSASLTRSAKAAKRRNWQQFFQTLPQVFRWTFIPEAVAVYGLLLRRRLKDEI